MDRTLCNPTWIHAPWRTNHRIANASIVKVMPQPQVQSNLAVDEIMWPSSINAEHVATEDAYDAAAGQDNNEIDVFAVDGGSGVEGLQVTQVGTSSLISFFSLLFCMMYAGVSPTGWTVGTRPTLRFSSIHVFSTVAHINSNIFFCPLS